MHDPMSVAHEVYIPLPWRRWKSKQLTLSALARIQLVTIWHNDPEKDGSDDSCAASKRLTDLQRQHVESWGDDEGGHPWFRAERAKETKRPADAEALLRGALWHVASCWRLNRWSLFHKRVTFASMAQLASELLHNPIDNVRSSLCLLPGWHTNETMVIEVPNEDCLDVNSPEWELHMDKERARPLTDYPAESSEYWRKQEGRSFYWMIARILKGRTARWWQQPKWHVWHWSLQIHPWQKFKRRWFERCDKCKARFKGASVFSDWHGTRKWCSQCNAQSMPDKVPPGPVISKA